MKYGGEGSVLILPRIARRELETTFFHIIVQGIASEYIFKDKEDIETYLELVKKYCEIHNVKIIAYCMMNNHAHFLVQTDVITQLSKAMQRINIVYGRYYNSKNNRIGYVFRDRFLSEAIRTEIQLLKCMVYIHNNPVKANKVREISEYKYSSYNEYTNGEGVAKPEIIRMVFGSIEGYLEQFNGVHIGYENEEFMEVFVDPEERQQKIIDDYLNVTGKTIKEIKEDEIELKRFLIEVRDKKGISNRKVAEILRMGREKLRKI